MNKKYLSKAIGSVLVFSTTIASATPFNSFDPRSMAMGGAGVAVANTATAPFFNPSILSVTRDEDDFALELPIIGIRAYDPEEFADSVDAFQDAHYDTALNNSIDVVGNLTNISPSDAQKYRDVATNTEALNTGLKSLDAKPLQLEIGAAVVIGIPSKSYGAAFSASVSGVFAGTVNYNDEKLLSDISSDVTAFATCVETNSKTCAVDLGLKYVSSTGEIVNPDTNVAFNASNDIKSEVNVLGLITQELALALSREFTLGGSSIAVGITPKLVTTTIYDYAVNANTADTDDMDADDYSHEYNDFNFDIGVAKNYNNGWRTGLVIKNVIAHEYKTYRKINGSKQATNTIIKTNAQARLGISHSSDWHTVAIDVDLTENEPVAFEKKSRYVALGAEFNLADWAQLRAGYRIDTNDNSRNIPSVGLGLSPLGLHVDIAAAVTDNEIGASLQVGFRF